LDIIWNHNTSTNIKSTNQSGINNINKEITINTQIFATIFNRDRSQRCFDQSRLSTNSTLRGITIDSRFEYRNASDSIRFNDDGDSNEIDQNDWQHEKHLDPRISTEHGITIEARPDDENASLPIRFNDDGDSNEINESDWQL
jgi:hypothetical protein